MSVTVADLTAALDDVPEQARRIAERRAEIERQHATVDELRQQAVRTSADGRCFDLGGGNIMRIASMADGPTPRGSSVLFVMALMPMIEEDVEDFHGGWA
jgi:hypothetical protein